MPATPPRALEMLRPRRAHLPRVKAKDGKLIGLSSIYGEVAVPTHIISELAFGEFERQNFRSAYESWLTIPAQEPDYGDGE